GQVGQADLLGGVGRAVVDDEHLEVAERLAEGGVERPGQVTAVVVGGDDDADGGGHGTAASRARVNGFATREMQKRYFPDGSCGMRSTYSHSYSTSGPKRLAT